MATVVIIPGSFVLANVYKAQVESLAKQGIPTAVVSLPSVGPRAEGAATMSDDVEEIVRVVEPLLDQGKEVILFTHSYGGIPTTQSLKTLSSKSRSASGKAGGVNAVIYLASIILSPGTCNWDLFKDKLTDFVAIEVSNACCFSLLNVQSEHSTLSVPCYCYCYCYCYCCCY